MKNRKLLQTLLVLSNLVVVASCGNNPTEQPTTEQPTSEFLPTDSDSMPSVSDSTPEAPEVKFDSATVVYDGLEHSLSVEDLPSDAKVEYSENKFVEPGQYEVTAKVTFANGEVTNLTATLTIDKKESVLTAETIQEAIHGGEGALPTYTIDNSEQKINVKKVFTPGEHKLVLCAMESEHYKQSNQVVVNFKVRLSNDLGVIFDSANYEVDGETKTLTASNIPDGYYAEYENNSASTQGTYQAVCKIFNDAGELKLTLNALLKLDNTKNMAFEEYLNQFFVDYMGDDFLSWNIITENPENFGYTRDPETKATWYTYEPMEENYKEEGYNEMLSYHALLKEFENQPLSYSQKISYNLLDAFFLENLEYYNPENIYDPMAELHYVDQFGGYAADFGTYIEAYELRREQDIIDVLSYIESLPEAFASYVTYVDDKAKYGYPLSNYTLTEMIGYLDSVTEQGEDYYLAGYIGNKIDAVDFLSEDQKEAYKAQVNSYISEYYMPAFASLSNDLATKMDKCTVEGYYAAYGEVGKAHYEYDLKYLFGTPDMDFVEYGNYLKAKMDEHSELMNSIIAKVNSADGNTYNKFIAFLQKGASVVKIKDPNEMIDYLKNFATTIVPTLEVTPEISVKYMDDAAAQVSNAMAYYMKSPLDSNDSEHITLNEFLLSTDYNSALTTMAHEGYPGHLYAYLYNKQLDISNVAKIMTSTAHAEGWAKYVELKLLKYIPNNNPYSLKDMQGVKLYCDYMYANELLAYTLYTYVDYGIHYLGWQAGDVGLVMSQAGFDASGAENMYRKLIEIPTQYAAYGYGINYFVDLHDYAKEQLGKNYNEIEFNSVILSHGWCSLGELKKVTDEYIENTKHLFSITDSE